jgi:hypothetical protein
MRNSSWRMATLLVGLALAASGCNLLTSLQGPDDKAITSAIQAKMFQDPVLKARDIRVVSQKGVVVLEGTVESDQEKAVAERLANEAKGVKQVINQLSVVPTAPAAAPAPARAEAPANAGVTPPPPAPRPKRHHRAAPPAPPEKPAVAESAPPPAASPATPPAAAPQPAQAESRPAPPPPPEQVTVSAGETITIRTIDPIDSSRNQPGEEFAATVDAPVVVENRVVIPRGSDARIRLVEARSAGHMSGKSELRLELISLTVNGTMYNVQTSMIERAGASRGKRTAETVGGGAALGALIGAIAGGGKGAAIGAGIGAGAGTGVQMGTHGQQVKIPSETKLDFTLKTLLSVTL